MDLNIPPLKTNNEAAKNDTRTTLPSSPSNSKLNNVTDPSSELTEEDIFLMKNLSEKFNQVNEDQSAFSQVDSQSKCDDDVGDETTSQTNFDQNDDLGVAIPVGSTESNNKLPPTPSNNYVSYAQAVKHGRRVVLQNGYVFGRDRISPDKYQLNNKTVTLLNYPFEPLVTENIENSEEYQKAFSGAKVYIVGTAHFSNESREDVIRTISQTQPDFVMVELCSSRISILSMNEEELLREASSLNRQKIMAIIKQSGLIQGLMHVLLLSTSAHITRQLGMAPGGEFRAAHSESKKVMNCALVLGDRPLHVTLKRALHSLSFFQKMRFLYHILLTNSTEIKQEDVERCKNKDLLESLLKEMAGEFPQLSRILIEERDIYMTNILHTLIQRYTVDKYNASKEAGVEFEPIIGVAIVGIGHVNGIVSNWNKHIDTASLLTIPTPSRTSRLIKFSIKLTFYIGVGYMTYKVGRFACNQIAKLSIRA